MLMLTFMFMCIFVFVFVFVFVFMFVFTLIFTYCLDVLQVARSPHCPYCSPEYSATTYQRESAQGLSIMASITTSSPA